MGHGAIDVIARHQQVVNALQQRIIYHPCGLGHLAHKALDDRGRVKMAKYCLWVFKVVPIF